jgi:flagellar motility protein MotE (MotC chaperone)
MRAVELPAPGDLRRRLSPLPLTLAALVALLALRLGALAPAPAPLGQAAAPAPRAEVAATPAARAAIPVDQSAAPAADPADPGVPGHDDTAGRGRGPVASAALEAPWSAPADAGRDHATRLIDEMLAPAAGDERPDPVVTPPRDEPLAAEPFLAERRALARQREALNVRRLAVEVAEDRLRELVDTLSALKTEIDGRLAELEASDEARLARLVGLYEKMRAKDAARIFDDLDFEVLVPLALTMNQRKLAPIVAAMTPEVARELTGEVAARRADADLAAVVAAADR